MSIDSIQTLARDEMAAVDTLIRAELHSDVLLIKQISEHIIVAGGKRLRPMLTVLAARAAGYAGRDHTALAAIIEFIHTATLLHDDVVDESDLRRERFGRRFPVFARLPIDGGSGFDDHPETSGRHHQPHRRR